MPMGERWWDEIQWRIVLDTQPIKMTSIIDRKDNIDCILLSLTRFWVHLFKVDHTHGHAHAHAHANVHVHISVILDHHYNKCKDNSLTLDLWLDLLNNKYVLKVPPRRKRTRVVDIRASVSIGSVALLLQGGGSPLFSYIGPSRLPQIHRLIGARTYHPSPTTH